ncbi:MAG: hypothetical protein SFY80_00085 [Verrucomicrobiota bacterium]|nr:hypothetical protein [Verrucomicrobiota bacterium]
MKIDFGRALHEWDGFGFNYVETAQTRDYAEDAQDYGGLRTLSEVDRQRVSILVFGDDGLKPGLLKLFLDPFHQGKPCAGYQWGSMVVQPEYYDHTRSAKSMLWMASEAVAAAKSRGESLSAMVTLYGPPGWMTAQGFVRGRDLAPDMLLEVCKYLASWTLYLEKEIGLKIVAVSPHNEGEDWMRWPLDGSTADVASHDHNLYWPTEQLVAFVPLMRQVLDANQLKHTAVSCGETSNWVRFAHWGYADALAQSREAMENLGLITSHGFWGAYMGQWNADHRSTGTDQLRAIKPTLHAWTTSTGWGRDFTGLIWEAQQSIYVAKINGFIPWAGMQYSKLWQGGDPNPQTALRVLEDGTVKVEQEYYTYKHLTRAGLPGMDVVPAFVNDTEIVPLAFGPGRSGSAAAMVLANISASPKTLLLQACGAGQNTFQGIQSTAESLWTDIGEITLGDAITLPAKSITTFIGKSKA